MATLYSPNQPFLKQDFDPVDYLNTTLPPLTATSRPIQTSQGRSVPLSELNTQLQTLLGQLDAHMSRLSTTLTQLTDEILRSGSRLSYEVEVLRSDTAGLVDSLDNGLKRDISTFTSVTPTQADPGQPDARISNPAPPYLQRLQTLTTIHARLETVIKLFGDAMAWPLAPSENPLASSLIAISAPESDAELRSREEKAKAYTERLRNEIDDSIGSGDDAAGLDAAVERVEQLRLLAEVWRGTAEEKARLRVVEDLGRPVEETLRELERLGQGQGRNVGRAEVGRGVDYRYGDLGGGASAGGGHANTKQTGEGGYGFLSNLRALKNEMYLE
ncbi:hypothetical protein LTR62_005653 [Meristemomyces frigidus]|uniref:Uncharacterized protein n=1 Tax=Meristemomyces frigidus TaxID=1508187 RepID=A0AAN7YF26_9PEZI|nr:hypothetical protein LTR62_005653 [Meristemomyces frigidus]